MDRSANVQRGFLARFLGIVGGVALAGCHAAPTGPLPREVHPEARALFEQARANIDEAAQLTSGSHGRRIRVEEARHALTRASELDSDYFAPLALLQDLEFEANPGSGANWPRPLDGAGAAELTLAARALQPTEPELARQFLARAIQADPEFGWARYGAAVDAARADRFDSALADLEIAVAVDPDFLRAWRLRAQLLDEVGSREDALKAHDRVLELDPGDVAFRVRSARILLESDSRREAQRAESLLREAIAALEGSSNPADQALREGALRDLGLALIHQGGRARDAVAILEGVFERDPTRFDALLDLGWVYRNQLDDPKAALAAYEGFLDKSGGDEAALDTRFLLDRHLYVPILVDELRAELGLPPRSKPAEARD